MLIKYPSLELNWLPKPKDVRYPNIVIESVTNCSGYYNKPQKGQTAINGRFYDLDRGLIVLNEYHDLRPSTIAHELRHHIQYLDGVDIESEWKIDKGYKESIIEYFTTYPSEIDALLYEVKHSPDEVNQQWYEWIIQNNPADFMRN